MVSYFMAKINDPMRGDVHPQSFTGAMFESLEEIETWEKTYLGQDDYITEIIDVRDNTIVYDRYSK